MHENMQYQEQGQDGLKILSKRPHNSPNQKMSLELEAKTLALRKSKNLGARRIQSELLINEQIKLGLATIDKVLKKQKVESIVIYCRKPDFKRYSKPIPGERGQMDTCKMPLICTSTLLLMTL